MTICHCEDLPILWAAHADAYAGEQLVKEGVDEDGTTVLRCMATGKRWVQDHPRDADGIRTLRLRWDVLTPGDVVGYLNRRPGLDEVMLTMDPAVEHQPLPDAPVLHGVTELRDYARQQLSDEHAPRSAAITVVERDDAALVLGQVSHVHDGEYVEHRPAAWIVDVRDARVTRVRAFGDWAQARLAAGVT